MSLALCWAGCAILASACTTLSSAATPTPNLAPTPSSSPTVIRFFTTESDTNQISTLLGLIDEYQQLNPDVEIEIVLASPASRGRRLLTVLASGVDLGIFEIEPTFMTEWADAGYLLPLDDVVQAIGLADYAQGSLFRHTGHVYAIPYASSVYGLWVRTDLLRAAGLDVPTTYEEVLHAAQALTRDEVYGIGLPAGQNIATVNYFSTFLWQNGGDYFDCRGNVVFDKPQALTAIEKWTALAQQAPPGFTTWGFNEQIEAFMRARVAMVMYAGRLGAQLDLNAPDMADDVELVFPPWGDIEVTLGVWSRFAIASGTEHQAEAKAFLQWLMSGDRLLRYDLTVPGHMIPPLHSVQRLTLQTETPFTTRHEDWLQSFYTWLPLTSHPAMNMGVIRDGSFAPTSEAPPWADEAFGPSGIIVAMLQAISLQHREPEDAWQEAITRLQTLVANWRTGNPDWQPSACL